VLGVTAVIHAALHTAEHLKATSDEYLPSEEAKTESRQLARALAEAICQASSNKRLQRSAQAGEEGAVGRTTPIGQQGGRPLLIRGPDRCF
jgi:hypothetical protein